MMMEDMEEPPAIKWELFFGKEVRDNTDDYLGYLMYLTEKEMKRAWWTNSSICRSGPTRRRHLGSP
jgi:hypothetical protein